MDILDQKVVYYFSTQLPTTLSWSMKELILLTKSKPLFACDGWMMNSIAMKNFLVFINWNLPMLHHS